MNYIEVSIPKPSDPIKLDLLIADLGDAGFESFAEEEETLLAYVPEPEYKVESLKNILGEGYDNKKVRVIGERNWNEVWESNYPPVLIDGRCSIRASFHEAPEDVAFDIVLNPKMAFGTAHHETTAMMISFLLDTEVRGKAVLDMGCGTGVLAILAAMKGATNVVAIDNDPWAYENAREHMVINRTETVEVMEGDATLLEDLGPFDLILANINRNILLKDIPAYAGRLQHGGQLLLSGFYEGDLKDISAVCKQSGLKFVKSHTKNEWMAVCFEKS